MKRVIIDAGIMVVIGASIFLFQEHLFSNVGRYQLSQASYQWIDAINDQKNDETKLVKIDTKTGRVWYYSKVFMPDKDGTPHFFYNWIEMKKGQDIF